MDGSFLKQLMLISSANLSQPYRSTKTSKIVASFTPCSGLLGCSFLLVFSLFILDVESIELSMCSDGDHSLHKQ